MSRRSWTQARPAMSPQAKEFRKRRLIEATLTRQRRARRLTRLAALQRDQTRRILRPT